MKCKHCGYKTKFVYKMKNHLFKKHGIKREYLDLLMKNILSKGCIWRFVK